MYVLTRIDTDESGYETTSVEACSAVRDNLLAFLCSAISMPLEHAEAMIRLNHHCAGYSCDTTLLKGDCQSVQFRIEQVQLV